MTDRSNDYTFARRGIWLVGHVVAVVGVVMFVMLGMWQLRRLEARRAINTAVEQRSSGTAMEIGDLVARWNEDPSKVEYQRITVEGTYDFANEFFVGPSSRGGASGYRVVTPLDYGTGVVLVARGWVSLATQGPPYDGATESGVGVVDGYIRNDEVDARGIPKLGLEIDSGRAGRLDISTLTPAADAAPFFVVQRLPEPGLQILDDASLDEGRNLSYAVQWFLFASVTTIGYPILIVRTAKPTKPKSRNY